MTKPVQFLSPRMVGDRFSGHAIPLEVLKDLAVLEELVVEVAKWHYFKDHPDRKRTPRGFTDGVSLRLTQIDEGSAIANIALFVASTAASLLPPENQECFEKARQSIVAAISAAEHDRKILGHLADSHLAYFDRIGRSLRDGESIEFTYVGLAEPARLNKTTRRRLTLAASGMSGFTEEVVVRGMIPEVDQRKECFELQLISGRVVGAPLEPQHIDVILSASNGYRSGARVAIQGIGRYDRNERLVALDSVEHITELASNDAAARLDELRLLQNGWLDGKGIAPSASGLDWLTERLESQLPDELPVPFLYPTAEGGVQAEWTIGSHEVSLEVSLETRQGEWHDLALDTDDVVERNLNLDDAADWQWLIEQIRDREGTGQ